MSKNTINDKVFTLLEDFLADNDLECYDIKFTKEGKDRILRIYIDKLNGEKNEYISTAYCELVSRFLSNKLDEDDVIEGKYYLEVSSPGMDRELITEKHFSKYKGEIVDVSLYKVLYGNKKFQGELIASKDDKIIIKDKDGKEIVFPKEQVAKVRLAIIF